MLRNDQRVLGREVNVDIGGVVMDWYAGNQQYTVPKTNWNFTFDLVN